MDRKKKITIHDIARELNVTASTVSRALQDHPRISASTKERVRELARKLNYQPNSVASSLRRGKGNTIGVIVPQIDRFFFASVMRGIEDVAYEAGYNVLMCQSFNSWEKEKKIVDSLLSGKIDGLMASLALETRNFDHFKKVQNEGIPLVFFDRVPEFPDVHKVEADDFAGGYKAVEHLISQRCKRIIHFSGPPHVNIYRNRLAGYKAALTEHGLPYRESYIFENTLTRQAGEEAADRISKMDPLPDAIFSAGDYSALGAIMKLKQLGLKVPDDIAVVGFANEPYDDLIDPGLSSVDQHSIEIGRNVAKLFFDGLTDPKALKIPKKIILNTDLQIRASSLRNRGK